MSCPVERHDIYLGHEQPSESNEKRRASLRVFLRAARERVQPEVHHLPIRQGRRTPGLRREEVAELAGVSTAWYTLLETARNRRVSTRMLDRVAKALVLSDAEKLRLYSLAFPEIPAPSAEAPEQRRADLIAVGGLTTLVRRLSEGTSVPSLAQATVEFVWSAVEPCKIVAFLERDFELGKYRCIRFCNSDRASAPVADALYDLNPGFLRATTQRTIVTEVTSTSRDSFVGERLELGSAHFLAAGVSTSHCEGVLLYAAQHQPLFSCFEHERLLLVADLLGLAISRLSTRATATVRA